MSRADPGSRASTQAASPLRAFTKRALATTTVDASCPQTKGGPERQSKGAGAWGPSNAEPSFLTRARARRYPARMRALFVSGLLCVCLVPLAGCGPVLSVWLISDAEAKFAGARAAEAQTYAPYEFTAAEAYLKKAHEEFGYADYGPALDYAYKAAALAGQGAERARDARTKHLDTSSTTPSSSVPTTTPTAPSTTEQKLLIKKVPAPAPAEGQPQ
jgi:hypothetical protein